MPKKPAGERRVRNKETCVCLLYAVKHGRPEGGGGVHVDAHNAVERTVLRTIGRLQVDVGGVEHPAGDSRCAINTVHFTPTIYLGIA